MDSEQMKAVESHPKESKMDDQAMKHNDSYREMLIMTVLSFISMYVAMYAMVNAFDNVYNHLNQVYMAGLMTAPMVIISFIVMGRMYPDKRRNALFIGASVLAALVFFIFIRQQTAISDKQFLRSMIPHHAGAILMCDQAPISDPEIIELCEQIVSSQQEEITQMEAILERLER